MTEIYNEIAGAVSGKEWYSGKYSVVNLARGKGEDESPEPNEYSSTVENSGNQDETDNNIDGKSENKTENKIYTNSGNTVIIDKKDNTGLDAAPCIGENIVNKLRKGIKKAKKEKGLLPYKYNNVNVESEVSTVTMLLNSVAKSEVVNGNGYENLKSLFENNHKNFKGLTVGIYEDEPKKELCYILKFESNGVWTGYTMKKVNDKVGMVQKVKWNGNKWEVDGEILNFNLKK